MHLRKTLSSKFVSKLALGSRGRHFIFPGHSLYSILERKVENKGSQCPPKISAGCAEMQENDANRLPAASGTEQGQKAVPEEVPREDFGVLKRRCLPSLGRT